MRPRLLLASLGSLIAFGCLGALDAGTALPDSTSPNAIEYASFSSQALSGTVHYSVSLPPSYYAHSTTRYPVIYFLHGLPAGPNAYKGIGWVVDALRRSGHEAIVIGAQGARHGDTDPEWLNWGSGREWEKAVARELVSVVDSRYRTIASREGRALIGISAGGYGAALIGYHHPGIFSVFQSWSGYFEPTTPDGSKTLDLGSDQRNKHANLHRLAPNLRRRLGKYLNSTYFSFFIGTRDSFLADNRQLNGELSKYDVPHAKFKTYQGEHSMSLWKEHATAWIARALSLAASPG